MKLAKILAVSMISVAGIFAGGVQATPTLTISDNNGHSVTVSAVGGVASFNGAIGDWLVNVVTGQTKPALGSAADPSMDLNFTDNYGGAGGIGSILTIEWSDTDFTGFGTFSSLIGGTLGVDTSVSFSDYASSTNLLNTLTTLVCTRNFGPGGAYSGGCSGTYGGPAPFSLTELVTLSVTGDHTTNHTNSSGDHALTLVPEPATLALLGIGLLGAGVVGRRKMS